MKLRVMETAALVVIAALPIAALGCGETSNLVGVGAGAGGTGAIAGRASSGTTQTEGGGDPVGNVGGTKSSAGANTGGSTAGAGTGGTKPNAGGSGPGDCQSLDGNWELCSAPHRATPGKCQYTPSTEPLPALGGADDECHLDSECTAHPFGQCYQEISAFTRKNACRYGCVQDSDCATGNVCVCAGASPSAFGSWSPSSPGQCYPSGNCGSDLDCPSGEQCLPYDSMPGCYSPVFTCTTPDDECTTTSDCGSPAEKSCGFNGKKRVCEAVQCVVD